MGISRLSRFIAVICVVPLVFGALLYTSATNAGPIGPTENGDVNGDGGIDIGDPLYLLNYLFTSGPPPIAIAGSPCACDVGLFRISDASGAGAATLAFGPTDLCMVGIDPSGLQGLLFSDPDGFRFLNPMATAPGPVRLHLGPTDLCRIETDPLGVSGLLLRDPGGIRILNPTMTGPETLYFGPTNLCRMGIDPSQSGLLVVDPFGLRIQSPTTAAASRLLFGSSDLCTIAVGDPSGILGMIFTDPDGFLFDGGAVSASQFIQTSTEKHKENIRPIEGALEKIRALNGVSFEWTEELGGRTDIGFIAEQVASVIPEVVAQDASGEAYGLSYGNLVALAVEGIKEQQSKIETLESQKEELEEDLAALGTRNDELAERLGRLEALLIDKKTGGE